MDELDEIRRDARYAQTLREGAPGSQAGAEDLKTRLQGGNPETGRALRSQAPADMTEVRNRLVAGGAADQPAYPLRERVERAGAANQPAMDALKDRLTTGAQNSPVAANASISAVPPRNVPLGTAGGNVSTPPSTINVAGDGTAGVVRNPNINPAVRGGMSPEAEAFLKERAATPGAAVPGAAPAGAQAATAAAEAAPSTISKVARAAPYVGLATDAAFEGAKVAKVAQDPTMNRADTLTQAGEGMAKVGAAGLGAYYGGVAGAGLGAMTGPAAPVAVPVLATAGAIAGGIAGPKAVGDVITAGREGINKLRGMFGLAPKDTSSPADSAVPQYQRDRDAAAAAKAGGGAAPANAANQPSTTPQAPSKGASSGGATTIAGVGQQAAAAAPKTPVVDYKLGTNAVEVIHPGGERYVQLFGENGATAAVPKNVFDAGSGAIARYADEVQQAQSRALTDPNQTLAKQRLENEGRVATQEKANEGHVAGVREQLKAPVAMKNAMGETTGFGAVQPGGDVKITPVPKAAPARAKALADAKAAVQQGADPNAVNSQLKQWGYEPLNFGSK